MAIFNEFPQTNFHELNLDWIIKIIKDLDLKWDEFSEKWIDDLQAAVDNWLDEHPEATTTVQDNSLTLAKFSESLKLLTVNNFVTPEMFGAKGDGETDDSTAFQEMINSIENGGVFILTGTYLLKGNVSINRHSNETIPYTFIGLNKASITFSEYYAFTGSANDYGNLHFINVIFKDSYNIFRCDRKLIRVSCDHCSFDNVENICLATNVCQSMYFDNCVMRNCAYVVNGNSSDARGYDIKITNCRIEACVNCYIMPYSPSYQINIINNCIEGLSGTVASFGVTRTVIIADNYFERNTRYIVFNNANTNNAVIEGNNVTDPYAVILVELPTSVNYPASIKILNNNITDITTPAQIYSQLTAAQEYSGLIISGNNKMRSDDSLRPSQGTKQSQRSEFYTSDLTGELLSTFSEVAGRIVKDMYDSNHYHGLFECSTNAHGIVTGYVIIDKSNGYGFINIANATTIGYGTFSYVSQQGTLRTVSLS